MAISSSILKDENKTLIVSPDEKSSKEARLETEKLLQQGSLVGLDTYATDNMIKFKNGSMIEFVVPEKDNGNCSGRRSQLPMMFYDYEYCNQDDIDEVLELFLRKELRNGKYIGIKGNK